MEIRSETLFIVVLGYKESIGVGFIKIGQLEKKALRNAKALRNVFGNVTVPMVCPVVPRTKRYRSR